MLESRVGSALRNCRVKFYSLSSFADADRKLLQGQLFRPALIPRLCLNTMTISAITSSAAEICRKLIADPIRGHDLQLVASQMLKFAESVGHDGSNDPFYEDCLRLMISDITERVA